MLDLCSNCGFVAGMPFVIPSSPFERIMCTNRALLDSETERVREIVLETENDLTQLEDQIALLHRERDKLRRYVESHKVLLSPIRRLPPEILSEIFLACLTPWNEMLTLAIFDVKSLPWLLGHICSQWRAVALSSPKLWSSVVISLYQLQMDLEMAVCMVETWLQRGAECPLFVRFLCGHRSLESHPILDALASSSHRWQDVTFSITIPLLSSLTHIRGHLPSLQRLEIQLDLEAVPDPGIFDAFEFAPCLYEVSAPHFANLPLKLPWSQLTQYTGPIIGPETLEVLRHASNVVACTLYTYAFTGLHNSAPSGTVQLPQLRTLCIHSESDAGLLDGLVLPVLEDISFREHPNGGTLVSVLSLLRRSSCSLKKLHLSGGPFDDTIIRLIQETSTLVEVNINFGNESIANELVARLTNRRDERPILVPNLGSIEFSFRVRPTRTFDHRLFVDMIESRWRLDGLHQQTDSRLQYVRLWSGPIFDQWDDTRLDDFQAEGLDVAVI